MLNLCWLTRWSCWRVWAPTTDDSCSPGVTAHKQRRDVRNSAAMWEADQGAELTEVGMVGEPELRGQDGRASPLVGLFQMDEETLLKSGQLLCGSDGFGRFIPLKTKQTHMSAPRRWTSYPTFLCSLGHYLSSGWRSCWAQMLWRSWQTGSLDWWPCLLDSIIQNFEGEKRWN